MGENERKAEPPPGWFREKIRWINIKTYSKLKNILYTSVMFFLLCGEKQMQKNKHMLISILMWWVMMNGPMDIIIFLLPSQSKFFATTLMGCTYGASDFRELVADFSVKCNNTIFGFLYWNIFIASCKEILAKCVLF